MAKDFRDVFFGCVTVAVMAAVANVLNVFQVF